MSADVDKVFKALADPTRRKLLDKLFKDDGQTLSALEQGLPMTRFGVMKHLKLYKVEIWSFGSSPSFVQKL